MLIDSHVHIHSCFDIDALLDAAVDNFRRARGAASAAANDAAPVGCLALTETARDHVYAAIVGGERRWLPKRWRVRATNDEAAIVLRSQTNAEIVMLAGSQIATAERLEVLALATTKRYPDKQPLAETLAALAADGVTAVIPWGFGKWWLGRGRLLADLIRRSEPRAFFLGDSGGRPMSAPRPKLFELAERSGLPVLPGTDSFPYPSQQGKAGSFGFAIGSWRADASPAAEFRSQLAELRQTPPSFGTRVDMLEFAWLQVAMNVRIRMQRFA